MYNNRNTLLRYKEITDVYNKHKESDIPNTRIHKKYIYPLFKISMRTLYKVLQTPIQRELNKLEQNG